MGAGLYGTIFAWPAGFFGFYGARNTSKQAGLLSAHMAFVRDFRNYFS